MYTKIKMNMLPVGVICLVAGLLLTGCDSGPSNQDKEAMMPETSAVPAEPAETESPSPRVLSKVPGFSLTNQDGETVSMDDLYGRVWVANFIFTECRGSCPLQTEEMKKLQRHMKLSDYWKDLRIISFSVDPEVDTPEVLTQYISDHKVSPLHWDFLTGTRDELWSLSKDGFKLPVAEDISNKEMPILHSQQFVLVDWEGRIRGYYDGLDADDVAALKRDTDLVLAEQVFFPAGVDNPSWVNSRKNAQISAAKDFKVFHDFKFTDRIRESGITFRHKVVDDAARVYKPVHYDHGNAIAVADVDGDGLYDIYFSTQAGSNELWRNTGNGKFEDITDKAGLRLNDRIGVGASFADTDNDGDPDLYITSVRVGNILYENDGKGNFRDITATSGLGHKAHSSGAVFFDYDRDGLLDMFLSNVGIYTSDETANVTVYTDDKGSIVTEEKYYIGFTDAFAGHLKGLEEKSVLYRNKGDNQFEDVTEQVNLVDTSWTGDATVIDANNDGWPDLYVLNMQGHDEYYENVEGKRFVKKSREIFPRTPWGAMGVKAFDFDNDGDQDLFVTDMHSDMSENIGPEKEKLKLPTTYTESFLVSGGKSIHGNAFYRNNGDGTFTEISDAIGAENFWPWGLGSGDVNADGYEDVFIASSMNYPFRYAVNSLLLNDAGAGFLDSEYVLGVEPRLHGRTAVPWFEVLCPDLDASKEKVCKPGDKGRKVVWGALGSRSSVIFDMDQDGDLDIVTQEMNTPPMVLVSNLSEQKKDLNYIKIRLTGTKSNRSGIGSTIRVFSGGQTYTKVNDGKSGYLSQSDYPVYFGLGENSEIEKVEITWPSGTVQTVGGPIASNKLLEITEQ